MNRFFRIALFASSLSAGLSAQAEVSDTLQDYAYRMPVAISGKDGVVALRLNSAIYLQARSPALADLRLFDADGKKIPFALQSATPTVRQESTTLDIKAFPLRGATANKQGEMALDIKTNPQGQVTNVKLKAAANAGTELQALLLDLGIKNSIQAPLLERIHFTLPENQGDYAAQVWLAVSDDLQNWDTLAAADLRWLKNAQGERLVQDEIRFEPRRFRYARLTWGSGTPREFAKIYATGEQQASGPSQFDSLLLTPQKGKFAQDLVYPASLALPVEKMNLVLTESNIVLPVEIGSYRQLPKVKAGQETRWEFMPQQTATFYQITQNGQLRQSGEIRMSPSHAQQWVLRLPEGSSAMPQLKVSWQNANVIFLASGKGPYQLAFGRDDVTSAATDLAQVAPGFSLAELTKIEFAQLGALQSQTKLANAEDASEALGQKARQKTYILWAVLLVGVALIGVMVLRLIKQQNPSQAS